MKRRVNERRSEKGLKKLGSGTRGLAKRLFGIPWLAGLDRPVVSRYARLVGDIVFGSPRRARPPAEAALQQQTEGEGQRNGAARGCERDAGEKVVGSGAVVGRLAVLCRMLPGSEYLLLRCRECTWGWARRW